jgi:hypothetical protein
MLRRFSVPNGTLFLTRAKFVPFVCVAAPVTSLTHMVSYFQFICAATVAGNLAAFAWDMKRRQLTVYGLPSASSIDGPWSAHHKLAEVLHHALVRCSEILFEDWRFVEGAWSHVFIDAGCKRTFPSSASDKWYVPCVYVHTKGVT